MSAADAAGLKAGKDYTGAPVGHIQFTGFQVYFGELGFSAALGGTSRKPSNDSSVNDRIQEAQRDALGRQRSLASFCSKLPAFETFLKCYGDKDCRRQVLLWRGWSERRIELAGFSKKYMWSREPEQIFQIYPEV